MAARVVDLPEPVGPVTRIRPFSLSQSCRTIGRHVKLFERKNFCRNRPEDCAFPASLHEDIDAEAGDISHLERKVTLMMLFKDSPLRIAHHVVDHGMDFLLAEGRMVQLFDFAIQPQHGWFAGAQMTI